MRPQQCNKGGLVVDQEGWYSMLYNLKAEAILVEWQNKSEEKRIQRLSVIWVGDGNIGMRAQHLHNYILSR